MKKIGIVGGLSWLSTIEYYQYLCELSHRHQLEPDLPGPPSIPEMAIESVDINKSFNLRGTLGEEASWQEYDAYFNAALKRIESSGADLAFIASNTPHNRYQAITRDIGIPVVSIFECVARRCTQLGIRELLILGTGPTMAASVFADVLSSHGVRGFSPSDENDQLAIVELINQMHVADLLGKSQVIEAVVQRCAEQFGDENGDRSMAVGLSCTELPLAFPEHANEAAFTVNGVLYLNTTLIHAIAVFESASGLTVDALV